MFIGREKELNILNKLYQSDRFEFAVVYGRRRVGKTALLNQFTKNKEAIFFAAVESSARQNLENFSTAILEYSADIPAGTSFSDFQTALQYSFDLAKKKRIVLIIDEYPYAAKANASIPSTLQLLIDKNKDTSKLMLILCGSSMSYMEDEVLAYKSPLYGRKTAQLKVLPFEFSDCCRFWKDAAPEAMALYYGLTGGIPQYMLQINEKESIEENIRSTFLNPSSALFEEPKNLLKQELREPSTYNAVISAIAGGSSRISEIATKTGLPTGACSTYIKSLIELGIIQKETPYGEKPSKKTTYSVSDNLYRFWYRFIPSNISLISRGADDIAWKRIKPQLSDYMGKIFEEICQQYLWQRLLSDDCPVQFTSLGRWWGNDPVLKEQAEIDIIGEQDKDTVLFGECKWQNEKTDIDVLNTLIHRSQLFHYTSATLYLFSKSGFTERCIKAAAKKGTVHLICYDNMVKR